MMRDTIYVTPSLKADHDLCLEGRRWAEEIGAVFVPRHRRTQEALQAAYGDRFLVYTTRGPQIMRSEGVHFFSLNMAELRIQHIRQGKSDYLLEAIGAAGPIRFLDCTCGFGADAMTASFALPSGSVIEALEDSPLLAAVTAWGLKYFTHEYADVTAALRRIQLRQENYMTYLTQAADQQYDVVYFDPMFEHPVRGSCQFQPVRAIMNHDGLTEECLHLAMKKAKRVVIKGRSFRHFRDRFPHSKQYGGKYSRVCYVVLEGDA